jgi:beta-lactam-binding protein with PASTA domain
MRSSIALLLLAGVALAGCSGDPAPQESSGDSPVVTSPSATTGGPESSSSGSPTADPAVTVPALIGMPWPAAQGAAAAAGIQVVPSFTGQPSQPGPQCLVVDQSLPPGQPAEQLVVTLLLQCASAPPISTPPPTPSP